MANTPSGATASGATATPGTAPPQRRPAAPVSPLRQQEARRRPISRGPAPVRLLWMIGGLVLALLIAVGIVLAIRSNQPVSLEGREQYSAPTGYNEHVAEGSPIQYATNPPSSGPHYPSPANWGVYPQPLPAGKFVHNLEHGGIVILYRCDTSCPDLAQQLQRVYNGLPNDPNFNERKAVVTPYPGLDHLVRVQAWGWTLPLDTVDPRLITAFYHEHVDQGPEKLP